MDIIIQTIEKLGNPDPVQNYQAKRSLEDLISLAGGPGQDKLASALASELNAKREVKEGDKTNHVIKYNPATRSTIARYLALVAGPEEIPALVEAMNDLDVRESARWALDRIQCAEATNALITAAVDGIGPEFRAGAINALGRRSGPEVVEALKKCAQDPYIEIRLVAAEALANQPDASSDTVITEAANGDGVFAERARARLAKARIRLAETLVRSGDKAAGKKIYEAVVSSNPDDAQKEAASIALAQIG